MAAYIQITFRNISKELSDILIAELNAIGYEGFEEEDTLLKGFIPVASFDDELLQGICRELNLDYTRETIGETNWNQVWESNFQPVIVDDFVMVRANFHESVKGVEHEIIITPKMSFGTGHHATTYMMVQEMRNIDFAGKRVLDFGTGTGILAILAKKLGASEVMGIDNDEWSIKNANENVERNNAAPIALVKANDAASHREFDVILANINKNVILDNMQIMAKQLVSGGVLLLSGLLTTDEPEVIARTKEEELTLVNRSEKSNWLLLKLSY